jgi:hypothetical protein
MRRTILAAAALLCLAATPAAAQRSGTYAVTGMSKDGPYEGVVQMQATGPDTWRVTWRIDGETVGGVGLAVPGALVVGYQHGRETGVAVYEVLPDGRLAGRWTTGRSAVVGTEVLMPR